MDLFRRCIVHKFAGLCFVALAIALASGGCTGRTEGDDGSDGGTPSGVSTLEEACLSSCAHTQGCKAVQGDCTTTCGIIERTYPGTCGEVATTLFECEVTLSCDELDAYGENYRTSPCS